MEPTTILMAIDQRKNGRATITALYTAERMNPQTMNHRHFQRNSVTTFRPSGSSARMSVKMALMELRTVLKLPS